MIFDMFRHISKKENCMYSGYNYMLLFFIYGLTFFSMGILALQQRTLKNSNLPLLKSLKKLGFFGLLHAGVEWISMIIIWNEFPQVKHELLLLNTVLNAVSYTFLWLFGLGLSKDNLKKNKIFDFLPIIIMSSWGVLFLINLMSDHLNDLATVDKFIIANRYLLALPSSLVTSLGLFNNAKTVQSLELKNSSVKFKILAVLFAAYGVSAGLVVRTHSDIMTNIMTTELFKATFGFPVELIRALMAIGITLVFINLIDIFMWEADYKIEKLSTQGLIFQERKKLGQQLHDSVIQNLFAAGMMLESEIESDAQKDTNLLQDTKAILNNVIKEIRGFIDHKAFEKVTIIDFREKMDELLEKFKLLGRLKVHVKYDSPDMTFGQLTSDQTTQIYYIVQEAVSNAIKHSGGQWVRVEITSTLERLSINISDNGKGFKLNQLNDQKHFGLVLMQDRAILINGILEIKTQETGVHIQLSIPWEI